MFTHILVATDFSEPSEAALDYARALALAFEARLTLLHVVEAPFVGGPLGSELLVVDPPAAHAELYDEARRRLQARARGSAGLKVQTEVVTGTSARMIIEYAAARGADLVVMGTHGRGGVAHLLMGSVAEKVVRGAPCPVLTVRGAKSGLAEAELVDAVSHLVPIDAQ